MAFEVTPEFLLKILELIVLTLTAMIISLQLATNFYQDIDSDSQEDVDSYMPFEMSFVAFFLIAISTIIILLYLIYFAIIGLGLSLSLIALLSILLPLSIGIFLFCMAITSIGQDMVDTLFSRDN